MGDFQRSLTVAARIGGFGKSGLGWLGFEFGGTESNKLFLQPRGAEGAELCATMAVAEG